MNLEFLSRPEWPALSWLARCARGSSTVSVYHGPRVEANPEWFCEAVWAGSYGDGGFDRTDLVAGSGGRLRNGCVIFVSSGSTVDRLQSIEDADGAWISNSLACLMAAARASVDPAYAGYYDDASSIILGLDRYKRSIATSAGSVALTYFDNLVWDGGRLRREPKPAERRDFSSYAKYHEFLTRTLESIVTNLSSAQRRFPFRMLGTLSSGYDSTAISALLRPLGLEEVLTFDRARRGDEDSGAAAARCLDLKVHLLGREAWRSMDFVEVPFIASYSSAEDMVFKAAEPLLEGRVLMTGYHGDKVWDKHTKNLSDQIVRGDPSGLALTEFRLWAGFINCAVPFFGVRQIREIHAISNSRELERWDIGGNYTRPICRRVAEDAGVPRELFGIRKRAITMNPFAGWDFMYNSRNFLTPRSLADYLGWIRESRWAWTKRGKLPPIADSRLNACINLVHMYCVDGMNRLGTMPLLWRRVRYRHYAPAYLNRYLFPWALSRAMERYPSSSLH